MNVYRFNHQKHLFGIRYAEHIIVHVPGPKVIPTRPLGAPSLEDGEHILTFPQQLGKLPVAHVCKLGTSDRIIKAAYHQQFLDTCVQELHTILQLEAACIVDQHPHGVPK